MAAFLAPLDGAAGWSLGAAAPLTIPDGLRFAGYAAPGLRATIGSAAGVAAPATGILARAADSAGRSFVELQVNPFPITQVATAIAGGLPTFYLVFDDDTGLTFPDGAGVAGGATVRDAAAVTVIAIGQDGIVADPVVWSRRIESALVAVGADASSWQPFVAAVGAALTGAPTSSVYLYDHAGTLQRDATVEIVVGTAATGHTVTMIEADGGDLQRTVARLNAAPVNPLPIADLWGSGAPSLRLRPAATPEAAQLVRLEDGRTAATEITITPADRSVAFTDLERWFAPQSPTAISGLARFTRNNLLRPLVNGPEFFDDLFVTLRDAQFDSGGFHLTGWSMYPSTKFTRREFGEAQDTDLTLAEATDLLAADAVPLTLEQAAHLIGAVGGGTRFLPAEFIQVQQGETLSAIEALAFHILVSGILVLDAAGVSFANTDAVGTVLLLVAWAGATAYTSYVLDNDGDPHEPNKDAVTALTSATNAAVADALALLAPYPARVEDNVPPPDLSALPLSVLFQSIRHLGIYHQKFGLVHTPSGLVAYCGGIDLHPNRLDDTDHLAAGPYHDVHARVDGNAARDLATSFEERWQHEGTGASAITVPAAYDPALAPGSDIVQVARTYFAPVAGAEARALPFAPDGDRTIADTMIAAIDAATESIYIEDQYLTPPDAYRSALLAKVADRAIRQLIIVVPGLTDQPFGDVVRQGFVTDLLDADGGAGIVRIGYPRRRFTSTSNDVRADSGKLILMEDLPASSGVLPTIFLGPPARIPAVPFWVAVDGELIHVYDESLQPNPDPATRTALTCERGPSTHLVRGGSAPMGTTTREHRRGTPATVVDLTEIYVHAKMMLVDDVFVGIGSANLNNRGLFYDGEINVFSVPAALRASPRNPVLALRRRLWAEMLDLPASVVGPLLTDPLSAAALFDRSPFAGNRFRPLDARTPHLMLGWTTGDGAFTTILQGLGFGVAAANQDTIYTQVVDPSSRTEQG
jgi:phosphatidylserine/phosphatidylglycerophosphate/cardiolipin synthase-like enzyme